VASNTFSLTVMSPERILVKNQESKSVLIEGAEGQIKILPQHADFITNLEAGIFHFDLQSGGPKHGVISSGFLEVKDGSVTVTAETLELLDEIDIERAKQAEKTAIDELGRDVTDETHFNKYQLKLQRALIRQQAASRT